MKIVHTEASWGWGGQEIRILTESAEFIKRGHEVKLVADPRSTIAKRAADYGVPLIPSTLRAKRLPDLMSLRAVLKTLKPDLVVCHSSTDHWLAALARLTLGRRFAIVRARHVSAKINGHCTTRWLYKKGCEGCLTTSASIQNAMVRQGLGAEADIVCIPTGILAPQSVKSHFDARKNLGISAEKFVISIVATLRSWKGHAHLIEALRIVNNPNILLLIAGDGPQRTTLEQLSAELNLTQQTLFLGQRNDVSDILCASDLFVLPSYANEGVPQAILQAMAHGVPIVSCPIGGIPEALKGYSSKFLVPPRSPGLLAQAIRESSEKFKKARPSQTPTRPSLIKYTLEGMYGDCLSLYQASIGRFKALKTQS